MNKEHEYIIDFDFQLIGNFFKLMEQVLENFLKQYDYHNKAKSFVEYMQWEADLYNKYKEYYGYVFYIGQKI